MKSLQEKYFEILNEIRNEKDELTGVDSEKIESFMNKSNSLFEDISNPIELKLDARVSAETINLSSVDFEKKLRNRKMSTTNFICQLNECSKSEAQDGKKRLDDLFKSLNSKYFGLKFANFFTLGEERRIARRRNIAQRDEDEDEATSIQKCDTTDDTFMKKIDKIVGLIGDKKLDYYWIVLDPNSFTKTIENIFSLSFAVKLQKLNLLFEEGGLFVIKSQSTNKSDDDGELRHFASTIDFLEYKQLCRSLRIEKAFLEL